MTDMPEPLRGAEPGSFARDTVVRRLPEMARRALVENEWLPEQRARFQAVLAEIPQAHLRPLHDPDAPDEQAWNRALRPFRLQDWLHAPWFLVETYFFRRMIEAAGYYQAGPSYGLDPYTWQKTQGLTAALPAAEQTAGQVGGWLESPARDPGAQVERLVELLKINLWGNQVDLSLWPVDQAERPDHATVQQGEPFLLCDQAAQAAAHLAGSPPGRVDFLVDNAGQELLFDLLLAAYLLGSGLARQVALHLKPHPTYVSDATVQDVLNSTAALRQSQRPPARAAGLGLEGWLAQGRLALLPDYFWTSPHPGWELPSRLRRKLSASRLVISKGDANYRRLVGDRRWPDAAPFSQVLGYFPAPLLALRVLKSDVVVGLRAGQAEDLTARTAGWRTSGRWGVMQFKD